MDLFYEKATLLKRNSEISLYDKVLNEWMCSIKHPIYRIGGP